MEPFDRNPGFGGHLRCGMHEVNTLIKGSCFYRVMQRIVRRRESEIAVGLGEDGSFGTQPVDGGVQNLGISTAAVKPNPGIENHGFRQQRRRDLQELFKIPQRQQNAEPVSP